MDNKTFDHVMVDIETMGTVSYSSIVSIGAVEFDINTGETGREFYVNIDLQSCLDLGLIVNGSTVMWWLTNSKESRLKLLEEPRIHIAMALDGFRKFLAENIADVQLWGNSNRFDLGLLHNAYIKCDLKLPWNYSFERDVRTLVSFAPKIKKEIQNKEGVSHNAIEDCHQQIRYCSKIWNKLK